jgi:hypothetical protein
MSVALPRSETVVSNITDEDLASLLMSDIFAKDAVPSSYDEEPIEVSPPVLPVLGPHWSGKRVRRYVRSLNRRIKAMSLSPKPRSTVVDIPDGLFAQYSGKGSKVGTVGLKTATEAAAAAGKTRGTKGKLPDGQDPSDDEKGSKGSKKRRGQGAGGGDDSSDYDDDGSDPSSSDDEDEDEVGEDSWGNDNNNV